MAGRPMRVQVERVPGSLELEALQDRLVPALEKISADLDDADDRITAASTFEPTDSSRWGDSPPATVAEALEALLTMIEDLTP